MRQATRPLPRVYNDRQATRPLPRVYNDRQATRPLPRGCESGKFCTDLIGSSRQLSIYHAPMWPHSKNMTHALEQSRGMSSQVIYDRVLQVVGHGFATDVPILDLGCGQGEFLAMLRDRGCARLTGCDGFDYEGTKNEVFTFVKADLNQRIPLPDESFQAVTALEVIEHLENPRHLIREMYRLTKKGGTVVVTTPNNESITSLTSLVVRGCYSAFTDASYPAHITPVLQVDLQRMLTEAGFENVTFIWSDSGRVPGTGVHWQSVLKGLARGRRFSDNLIAVCRKP